MAKHAGKPSPTRLWPVALWGKERKSRGGEEKKSMWKGKEKDSEGTQADVQAAIPADSILLFLFFSSLPPSLLYSPFLCSSNPPLVRLIFKPSVSVRSDLGAPEEKKECTRGRKDRERQPKVKLGIRLM